MSSVPLLLVDGHNLLFRACFGTPAQIYSRDPTRRDITTQFMFFALLRKAVTAELVGWPEILVVFDGENGSASRQLADPGYKANRPDDAEARRPLAGLADIKTGLDLFAVSWIELDDAEADDIIATLADTARPTRDVLILSTDQDYYQLLADPDNEGRSVRILNTARRPGARLLGPAHVLDRYGVAPSRFPDLRALAGDPADNIPGIRGIGTKSAAALLADGLSLDDLPNSGRLTGTRGAAVLAAWSQLLTWRDMIRLRLDLPLPAEPSGNRTPPLPIPGEIITKLGLWWAPGCSTPAVP